MFYDGSRCTYCGRCADVCPEKAIEMSPAYQLACSDKDDVTTRLDLFMLTCQRCGRCYGMENSNAIDRLGLSGFRYDSLQTRAMLKKTTDKLSLSMLDETETYKRPVK